MFNQKNVAFVITDPQVEFLKSTGKGFGATKDVLEKVNTIENLTKLFALAKERGYKRFISPHYFYPHDHKWQFKAAGETMMIENEMFWRDSQYSAIPEGSGADMIEEIKPFWMKILLLSTDIKSLAQKATTLTFNSAKMVSTPSSWLV